MRQTILLFLSSMIFSCGNSFHVPEDKEVEKAVKDMYEKRSEAAGAGGWIINDVKVLKSWPADDKEHYNAQVSVNGVHTSPALAVRLPDEPINETREVVLIWKDGEWIASDE